MRGFPSIAPKYAIPITVVSQSSDPAVISERLGMPLMLSKLIHSSNMLLELCCLRTEFHKLIYILNHNIGYKINRGETFARLTI